MSGANATAKAPRPTAAQAAAKEGWLTKQARDGSTWLKDKRFYVLVGNTLSYYLHEKDYRAGKDPKGSFVVVRWHHSQRPVPQAPFPFAVFVKGSNHTRVLSLSADSDDVRTSWLKAIIQSSMKQFFDADGGAESKINAERRRRLFEEAQLTLAHAQQVSAAAFSASTAAAAASSSSVEHQHQHLSSSSSSSSPHDPHHHGAGAATVGSGSGGVGGEEAAAAAAEHHRLMPSRPVSKSIDTIEMLARNMEIPNGIRFGDVIGPSILQTILSNNPTAVFLEVRWICFLFGVLLGNGGGALPSVRCPFALPPFSRFAAFFIPLYIYISFFPCSVSRFLAFCPFTRTSDPCFSTR